MDEKESESGSETKEWGNARDATGMVRCRKKTEDRAVTSGVEGGNEALCFRLSGVRRNKRLESSVRKQGV